MKKKIIMLGTILISTTSLLLVMFYIKTKDIKYISSNEIESYSNISMTLDGVQITSTPTTGYYKLAVDCENGSASWSNATHKLKVKVTTNPLKCTLAFTEVTEHLNIVAIYVDGVETNSLPSSTIHAYKLDYNSTNCTNGERVSWDNKNRKITIVPITATTYCNLYFISTTNGALKTISEKILEDNTIQSGDRPGLAQKQPFVDDTTGKIYWTSTNTESTCEAGDATYVSDGVCKSYYFAGNTTQNFLAFSGMMWRIVRINEDGGVRIIYQGNETFSSIEPRQGFTWIFAPYANSMAEADYLGWFYNNRALQSAFAQRIYVWLRQTMYPNYNAYLSRAAVYCNDRSVYSSTGGTFYGAYGRLEANTTSAPQFKCPDTVDAYTANPNYGNSKLETNLAGALLTADEAAYAGIYYTPTGQTNNNYLWYRSTAATSFTMTPLKYISGEGYMAKLENPAGVAMTSAIGGRFVTSLKDCVLYDRGTGTQADPYRVTISTTCSYVSTID